MKKMLAVPTILFLSSISLTGQSWAAAEAYSITSGGQDSGTPPSAAAVSGGSEREGQLLDIWKEHVRTLTRERDEARKQLESLKSQATSSASSASSAELEEAQQVIKSQASQIQSLESQISELKASSSDNGTTNAQLEEAERMVRNQQSQIQELQDQISQLKSAASAKIATKTVADPAQGARIKELTDEKIQLSRQIEELKSKNAMIQSEADAGRKQADTNQALQNRLDTLGIENKALKDEQNENESTIKSLEDKLSQAQKSGASIENLEARLEQIEKANVSLTKENEEAQKTIADLKQRETALLAVQARLADAEKNYESVMNEKQAAQQDVAQLQAKLREKEANAGRLAELEMTVKNKETELAASQRKIGELRASLQANIADLQKFKGNLGPYLESLIQAFEQRQAASE